MRLGGPSGELRCAGRPVANLGPWTAEACEPEPASHAHGSLTEGEDWTVTAQRVKVVDPFLWEHGSSYELVLHIGKRIARWVGAEIVDPGDPSARPLPAPAVWPFIQPPQVPRTPSIFIAHGKPEERRVA